MNVPVMDSGSVQMSATLADALARASEGARGLGASAVMIEHVLLSLCDDHDALAILDACHIDVDRLRENIWTAIEQSPQVGNVPAGGRMAVSSACSRILEAASTAARGGRRREINGAIVLAAIVGDGQNIGARLLELQGLTFDGAIQALRETMRAQPTQMVLPTRVPTEDVLARARERVQSRSAPSLRELMQNHSRPAGPPPLPTANVPAVSDAGDENRLNAGVYDVETTPIIVEPVDFTDAETEAADHADVEISDSVDADGEGETNALTLDEAADDGAKSDNDEERARPYGRFVSTRDQISSDANIDQLRSLAASDEMDSERSDADEHRESDPASGHVDEYDEPVAETQSAADLSELPLADPSMTPPLPPQPGYFASPGAADEVDETGSTVESLWPQSELPGDLPPVPENRRHSVQPPPLPPPLPPSTAGGAGMSPFPPPVAYPVNPTVQHFETSGTRIAPPEMPQTNFVHGSALPIEIRADDVSENVPRVMRTGRTERVEIRISSAQLTGRAHGQARQSGRARGGPLAITVTLKLRAPEGDFFIEAVSPETQWFNGFIGNDGEDAVWRYHVTPKLRGWTSLQIAASVRAVGPDGVPADSVFNNDEIDVKVRGNVGRSFVRWSGLVLAAAIGGTLVYLSDSSFDILNKLVK